MDRLDQCPDDKNHSAPMGKESSHLAQARGRTEVPCRRSGSGADQAGINSVNERVGANVTDCGSVGKGHAISV